MDPDRTAPAGTVAGCSGPDTARSGWSDDDALLLYEETVHECRLTSVRLRDYQPAQLFEGRLFDQATEVRFVATPDDRQIAAWITRETAQEGGTLGPFDAVRRRYYLLGKATTRPSVFEEARYTAREFVYPVEGSRPGETRAYVEVVEYHRRKPSWATVADIEEALNEPMLAAHRFLRVDEHPGEVRHA